MTVSRLNVVEGRTKGCQKQVSESDGTASDSVAEAAPSAPIDDQTDAAVDRRPVNNLQKYVHERADMLLARSAVSGRAHSVSHNLSTNCCFAIYVLI